jgi:hypothetical protein
VLAEGDPALCTVPQFRPERCRLRRPAYASANKAWDAAAGPLDLDLVVTNLSFPEGQANGLALSRNVISRHKSAAVLFITADANAAEFARDRRRVREHECQKRGQLQRYCEECWLPLQQRRGRGGGGIWRRRAINLDEVERIGV